METLNMLNTNVMDLATGAGVGAAAGAFVMKEIGWKRGAILGAVVVLVAPAARALIAKVAPAAK